jgi:hypothetical protein
MRQHYFKADVKYAKQDEESGEYKNVTESYLFEAMNFTDAEQKAHSKMEEIIPGSIYNVADIKKYRVNELIDSEGEDEFFKAKATYTSIDIDSDRETKVTDILLVNATNLDHAVQKVRDHYNDIQQGSGYRSDITIEAVQKEKIEEVFNALTEEELEIEVAEGAF